MTEVPDLEKENLMLKALIFSIVKRFGNDWNLELRDLKNDKLPPKMKIGWNLVGDDAILTLLFPSEGDGNA